MSELTEAQKLCNIGYEHLRDSDDQQAFSFFKAAAILGDDKAQFELGVAYSFGRGVKQDYEESYKYYELSAKQGNIYSMGNISLMLQNGQGTQRDEEKAIKYLKLAAEQGNTGAQCNLGGQYMAESKYLKQDINKALAWLSLAAKDTGHPASVDAKFKLGSIYYNFSDGGLRIEQALKAREWWHIAAQQGHLEAKRFLAKMFPGHDIAAWQAAEDFAKVTPLASEISQIIINYREGEIAPLDNNHVLKWISQFPVNDQYHILKELLHILNISYLSKEKAMSFIDEVVSLPELVTDDPEYFWNNVSLLDIQNGGSSQKDLITLVQDAVLKKYNVTANTNYSTGHDFIYIDDVLFSGNRLRSDLESWIKDYAPSSCTINIIVLAYYLGGQYYCTQKLEEKAKLCSKSIKFTWWRATELENRKKYYNHSDVYSATFFPNNTDVQSYLNVLTGAGYPPFKREVLKNPYNSPCFSSEQGRQTLEEAFLTAGVQIRKKCSLLPETMRPLGYSKLNTLGFGSTIIAYRNCPNTTPLVFWVGEPWYPLFPRKTNLKKK
ncbi:MAG: hypothetical protein BA863_08200 [Desulfovibrio sp. S3730MH75]|nr:MAG: hypothetical protein BA863_08200 [Desulfovibrio sp. S3730MH75]